MPYQGRTECFQCAAGTFNPKVAREAACNLCPPGTAVQVVHGFSQLPPRLLSSVETKI